MTPEPAPTTSGRATTACLCTAVRRADRALNRRYDEALRPSGLATTQYALLSLLAHARQPLAQSELAARQEMAGTTLTRTLQPLQRAGLVTIEPGQDRRTRYVAITPEGTAALERARPLWRAAQDRVIAEVGAERTGRLLDELAELLDRLHQT